MFLCAQSLSGTQVVALQAPLSMGFSRQEYWSGLPFPPPGDLPDLGTESMSLALASRFFTSEPPEIGKTDAEAPIRWPPDANSQLIGKDPDAGKD